MIKRRVFIVSMQEGPNLDFESQVQNSLQHCNIFASCNDMRYCVKSMKLLHKLFKKWVTFFFASKGVDYVALGKKISCTNEQKLTTMQIIIVLRSLEDKKHFIHQRKKCKFFSG